MYEKRRGGCVSGRIAVDDDMAVVVPKLDEIPSDLKEVEKKHEIRKGEEDQAIVKPKKIGKKHEIRNGEDDVAIVKPRGGSKG